MVAGNDSLLSVGIDGLYDFDFNRCSAARTRSRVVQIQRRQPQQQNQQQEKQRQFCIVRSSFVWRIVVVVILLSNLFQVIEGTSNFNVTLEPSVEIIHYVDGYIRGPGQIDLSNLVFEAVGESGKSYRDRLSNMGDDDYGFGSPLDDKVSAMDSAGNDDGIGDDYDRRFGRQRRLDGGIDKDATFVDIVIIPLSWACRCHPNTCDWASLGMGKQIAVAGGGGGEFSKDTSDNSAKDTFQWCCDDKAVSAGFCGMESEEWGRLLIDPNKFQGQQRSISIAKTGPVKKQMNKPLFDVQISRGYAILFANCNVDEGRPVSIQGQGKWRSKHGYLPGELFGFMNFYTCITLVIAVLLLWFARLMYQNRSTAVDLERYIAMAIALSFVESFTRLLDYILWNHSGNRSNSIIMTNALLKIFKEAFSRCLALAISMGYGLSCDTLPRKAWFVILGLGTAFVICTVTQDAFILLFNRLDIKSFSTRQSNISLLLVDLVTFTKRLLDAAFLLLILMSLSSTIEHFEQAGDSKKMHRTRQLRMLFIGSTIVGLVWTIVTFIDYYYIRLSDPDDDADTDNNYELIDEELRWMKDATTEFNYAFLLIGIAILWRPHASARDYAYFKKIDDAETTTLTLATDDNDDDNDGNEYRATLGNKYRNNTSRSTTKGDTSNGQSYKQNNNKHGEGDNNVMEIEITTRRR